MDSADEILNDLVNRLIHSAGKNLDSVILFGSAARSADGDTVSDLNVLCTLKSAGVSDLTDVAPVAAWWTGEKQQPAPLFFTSDELKSSADVFAIEFLDMQRHHRVLFGSDPIAALHIPMNLHRVQVEHDLRTTILRLRRLFLANSAESKALAAAIGSSSSSVKTILRHALITIGEPSPSSDEEVFDRVGATFGIEAGAFRAAARLKGEPSEGQDVRNAFGEYLRALEKLALALDGFLPKREWRRIARNSQLN